MDAAKAPKAAAPKRHRIYLLDDHPLVREWLTGVFEMEEDFEICGQADEGTVALAALGGIKPDVAIVDLSLPRSSGLEFIKEVHARYPEIRLLVLSMHDEASVAERAFRAGAHGYAIKRESAAQIVNGIRTVLRGEFYASPLLTAQLASRMFGGSAPALENPESVLSERELEVFRLRGQGRSAKEIASTLGVSAKTVGSFDARIKEKLGFQDVGQLMREAVLWQERQRGL